MKEFGSSFQKRIAGLKEGIIRRVPMGVSSPEEFTRIVEKEGITRVEAYIFSEDGSTHIGPLFRPYLRFGNADQTVYLGISRKGREIFYKEQYEDPDHSRRRSDLDRQKAALRALYTTHLRIKELSRVLPHVNFAITAERRMDMDVRTGFLLEEVALSHNLSPYPKKLDPKSLQALHEDWDRIAKGL